MVAKLNIFWFTRIVDLLSNLTLNIILDIDNLNWFCGFISFSGGQNSLWWWRITQAMIRIIVQFVILLPISTNQRPVSRSCDHSPPIRDQYPGPDCYSPLGQSAVIGMEIEAAARENDYMILCNWSPQASRNIPTFWMGLKLQVMKPSRIAMLHTLLTRSDHWCRWFNLAPTHQYQQNMGHVNQAWISKYVFNFIFDELMFILEWLWRYFNIPPCLSHSKVRFSSLLQKFSWSFFITVNC